MEDSPTERKLAAILAADVVGYSRLMSEREEATLDVLRGCQQVFQDCIRSHDGRVFGGAGDSVIAEFPSSVVALRCAVEIQDRLRLRNAQVPPEAAMHFRIGINVGDVIIDGNNLMGDGVNVAARLESLADPGGICISADVYRQVRKRLDLDFESLGRQKLKNIPEPLEVYRAVMDTSGVGTARKRKRSRHIRRGVVAAAVVGTIALSVLALNHLLPGSGDTTGSGEENLSSLLVLPFANMSGDPEQDYLVDGITEDIITDLSTLSQLMVMARNTTFSYKGQNVQPEEVGRELAVRYVLDGSVRKSGDRLRINTRLVDVGSGANVWAERYDRRLVEVFELQEEVTRKLVSALALNLTAGESERLARAETTSLEAYQLFLIGQQSFRIRSRTGYEQAVQAYRKALELDPAYARAWGALAVVLSHMIRDGWVDNPEEARQKTMEYALKAVSLDPGSPEVYWALGYVYMWQERFAEATEAIEKSIELSPSYADGYGLLAFINNWQGNGEDARRHILRAMALNPNYTFDYPWNLGLAEYTLGNYQASADALTRALERNEASMLPRLYLAACYVRLGRMEDAVWEVERSRISRPQVSIAHLERFLPYTNDALKNALFDDLRKAGLPE